MSDPAATITPAEPPLYDINAILAATAGMDDTAVAAMVAAAAPPSGKDHDAFFPEANQAEVKADFTMDPQGNVRPPEPTAPPAAAAPVIEPPAAAPAAPAAPPVAAPPQPDTPDARRAMLDTLAQQFPGESFAQLGARVDAAFQGADTHPADDTPPANPFEDIDTEYQAALTAAETARLAREALQDPDKGIAEFTPEALEAARAEDRAAQAAQAAFADLKEESLEAIRVNYPELLDTTSAAHQQLATIVAAKESLDPQFYDRSPTALAVECHQLAVKMGIKPVHLRPAAPTPPAAPVPPTNSPAAPQPPATPPAPAAPVPPTRPLASSAQSSHAAALAPPPGDPLAADVGAQAKAAANDPAAWAAFVASQIGGPSAAAASKFRIS